jgi:hypothetical protein
MFDDALTTMEKLNLDYFELFFAKTNLYLFTPNRTNGQNKKREHLP